MMTNLLEERIKDLVIFSQERCKFNENPDGYIKQEIEKYKRNWKRSHSLQKRLFESDKHFQKRLGLLSKECEEKVKSYADDLKKLAKEALKPVYVFYKGEKTQVPDNFYISFHSADTITFLNYLEEEDRKKNVITDEDREKARLLGCDVNYNYLQTLINKMTNVPDLVITIKHKDGMTMTLRRNGKEEDDGVVESEVVIAPQLVK